LTLNARLKEIIRKKNIFNIFLFNYINIKNQIKVEIFNRDDIVTFKAINDQ